MNYQQTTICTKEPHADRVPTVEIDFFTAYSRYPPVTCILQIGKWVCPVHVPRAELVAPLAGEDLVAALFVPSAADINRERQGKIEPPTDLAGWLNEMADFDRF